MDSSSTRRYLLMPQKQHHLNIVRFTQKSINRVSSVKWCSKGILKESKVSNSSKSGHNELSVHVCFGNIKVMFDFFRSEIVILISLMDNLRPFFLGPELPGLELELALFVAIRIAGKLHHVFIINLWLTKCENLYISFQCSLRKKTKKNNKNKIMAIQSVRISLDLKKLS